VIGAGTVINPIIKIVTTVAILAAVYFFLVKPVIDTTNDAFDKFVPDNFEDTFDTFPSDIQDQINDALDDSGQKNKLVDCVTNAGQNTDKVERCVDRFG
jgi:hypothetical protein